MNITAFDGAAGCGKTYSLLEELAEVLSHVGLSCHQRVLALTFMHGARLRLNEKLDRVDGLRNKFDCFTIDSFAWRVCFRFRYRLREAGAGALNASDFDHTCELAAMLLKDRSVSSWVSAVYPYILVDEAQDLKAQRLAIVEGLATTSRVFLAFDEFQCLNKENRPVAIVSWASGVCVPKTLIQNQRTKDQDLIRAANEIRSGQAITVNSSYHPSKNLLR
jgi:superfamily I DNA/RNA helicase